MIQANPEDHIDSLFGRDDPDDDRIAGVDIQADLLSHLATDRLCRLLTAVEQATGQAPALSVGLPQEQDLALVFQHAHGSGGVRRCAQTHGGALQRARHLPEAQQGRGAGLTPQHPHVQGDSQPHPYVGAGGPPASDSAR